MKLILKIGLNECVALLKVISSSSDQRPRWFTLPVKALNGFPVCSGIKMRGGRRWLARPLITRLERIKRCMMSNNLRPLQLFSKDIWIWNLLASFELLTSSKNSEASPSHRGLNPVTTLLLQCQYQLLHQQACVIVHPQSPCTSEPGEQVLRGAASQASHTMRCYFYVSDRLEPSLWGR